MQVLMPCYGLAENVLFAVGKHNMSTEPTRVRADANLLAHKGMLQPTTSQENSRVLVSSGQFMRSDLVSNSGCAVVVDPETHEELKNGKVGEIWMCGKSKTLGYWHKDAETARTFKVLCFCHSPVSF